MAKKKILIVEDETPLLMAIKSKLELEGYEVIYAEEGDEGLRKIKEEGPDLVLLDIILPKMDGFQILEHLNEEKITVPIIIISNSGQPVEIDRAIKLGVRDYLVKADFTPSDVLEKVKKVLEVAPNMLENEKPAGAGSDSGSGAGVLIVEDDEFLREVISQKLSKENFDVRAAIDAASASDLIREKRPEIILLDLILPGMDGFAFLDQLKKNQSTQSIPVIILSNLGQKEDIERAMSLGAIDYMIKANFTPGEIVQKVRNVLKEKFL